MAREFLLPELAESVVEGEIVSWLVTEGETVAMDQPVVEVMTDKVTVELPSPFAGVLRKRLVKEGEVVAVNTPIALFADEDEEVAARSADDRDREPVPSAGNDAEDEGERLSLFKPAKEADGGEIYQIRRSAEAKPSRVTGPFGRVLAVPAARKMARELGVVIEEVAGSGPNGRIRVADVQAHLQGTMRAAAVPTAATAGTTPPVTPAAPGDLEERLPFRGVRRAISKRMMASHLHSVRTLHVDEADVTGLVAMRQRLKPLAERRQARLSYLPFVMKAVISGLKAFPMMNASLDEEAGEIVRKRYYHLGMAVATEVGLVVPVVRNVDKKGILELAEEIQLLALKAREGRLEPGDVKGGTFSITNIGSLGGLFSFPIINVPEAAILGVHSIKKRPVVLDDDRIVARHMLYLSLSFDHRLIDGAEAARFTRHLIELLEMPEALMLES